MEVIEVIAGAGLGLALQVLHDAIKRANDRSSTRRCILDRLDATIFRITPLVAQVDKLVGEEVEVLKHILEKAVSLVDAYTELRRRNLIKKYRYKRRIKELEASLKWMVDVDVQVIQLADNKELKAKMSEMNNKLDKIISKPTDSLCFRKNSNHSISQGTNHNIVKPLDQISEVNDENSWSGGSKPKIDIHLHWSSRTRNKAREFHFTLK